MKLAGCVTGLFGLLREAWPWRRIHKMVAQHATVGTAHCSTQYGPTKVCAAPPSAPPGFRPESFFKDGRWHQRWEIFPAVFTPGHNDVEFLCNATCLPRDLSGKRVLDVGAWNGCFSFECERRGAEEVIALDLENPDDTGFNRLKKLLGSAVRHVNGSVYTLSPREFGTFDIILFFGVLYHLRHPLLAIDRLRSVCTGEVFVETHVIDDHAWLRSPSTLPPEMLSVLRKTPIWRQYGAFELHPQDQSNWFGPNVAAVMEAFQTAGFEVAHTESWPGRAAFHARATAVPARLLQETYEAFPVNRGVRWSDSDPSAKSTELTS
jgi:tRNA (mo5U34)-methyltransferase